ncbi:MAG TPA: hypothetical protein PLX83_19235 [bacterium]|nr:hypothetical protein [bacterium]
MSAHNLLYQLADAEVPANPVIGRKGRGTLYATGTAVPTDGSEGYAPGCLFVKEGTPNELYFNVGTKASCDFNKVTVA